MIFQGLGVKYVKHVKETGHTVSVEKANSIIYSPKKQ